MVRTRVHPDMPPIEPSARELMGISPELARMTEENEGIFTTEMEEIDQMETEAQVAEWRRESSGDDQILQIVRGFDADAVEEELDDCKDDPKMDPIEDPSEDIVRAIVQARQDENAPEDDDESTTMPPLQVRTRSASVSSEESESEDSDKKNGPGASTEGQDTTPPDAQPSWMAAFYANMVAHIDKTLDRKLQNNNKEMMGKVHRSINASTDTIERNLHKKLEDLRKEQEATKRSMSATIASEVTRQMQATNAVMQTLRGDFMAAKEQIDADINEVRDLKKKSEEAQAKLTEARLKWEAASAALKEHHESRIQQEAEMKQQFTTQNPKVNLSSYKPTMQICKTTTSYIPQEGALEWLICGIGVGAVVGRVFRFCPNRSPTHPHTAIVNHPAWTLNHLHHCIASDDADVAAATIDVVVAREA